MMPFSFQSKRHRLYREIADISRDDLVGSLDADSLTRGMTIDSVTGQIDWTPDTEGTVRTVVTVDDGRGGVDAQSIEMTVKSAAETNSPPRITSTPEGSLIVGQSFPYPITTIDPDGDLVSLSVDDDSIARGMQLIGDSLQWTPTATGEFETVITATDIHGNASTQTITLPVYAPVVDSDPPVITSNPTGPIHVGTPWTYTVTATDPDGDDGTVVVTLIAPDPANLPPGVDLTDNVLTWTPTTPGEQTFTIGVTDDSGVTTTQTFTPVAEDVRSGSPPRITSVPTGPAVRGSDFTYQVAAFDPDGDTLRYSLAAPVTGASINPSTGLLSFTPGVADSVDFVVAVSDIDAAGQVLDGTVTQSFTLGVVDAPGSIPRIVSSPVGPAVVGEVWTYSITATDADGDVITYGYESLTSNNGTGTDGTESITIDPATGELAWTPTTSTAQITIRVTANDNVDGTATQAFTIHSSTAPDPNAANQPPSFTTTPRGPVFVGQSWTYLLPAFLMSHFWPN